MGNGPLQQGIGYGDATVWNPNVPIQNFTNMLAQRKQQEQANNDEIAAQLTKVKSDGLRNDADREVFAKKFADIRANAIAGAGETNGIKKSLVKAQTTQQLLGLQDYVNRSKQQGAAEQAFGRSYMANPTPWADSAIAAHRKSIAAPLDSPDIIKDYTTQQRQVDVAKGNEAMTKMHKTALEAVPWSNDIQDGKDRIEVGQKGADLYKQRQIYPHDILAKDLQLYTADRNTQHLIDQQYGNINGDTPDETKTLRVTQAAIDRGDLIKGQDGVLQSNIKGEKDRRFKEYPKPDNWKEKALWHLNNHAGGQVSAANATEINIPYNTTGARPGNVNIHGYVPISIPKKNFAGIPAYDLTNGTKTLGLQSSGDYNVIGVGNVPFIKSGNEAGAIAQPDFVKNNPNDVEYRPMVHTQISDPQTGNNDYLIDYNKMPENIKSSKPIRQALANFKPVTSSEQVDQPASTTVLVNLNGRMGQIPKDKLKDFLKKYPIAKTQ